MRSKNVCGVIFPNVHDKLLPELTKLRAIGSVPFFARYRLIDFALSNMVNSGISKIGLIAKENYQSLMDHIGTGKPWDLDRKSGGLWLIPPYGNAEAGPYTGQIQGLINAMDFLRHSSEKYVVLSNADYAANFDLDIMIDSHIESGADITIAYKKNPDRKAYTDCMSFEISENEKISGIKITSSPADNFSLDIMVIEREKLMKLIVDAHEHGLTSLKRDILQPMVSRLDIRGFEVKKYAALIDGMDSFVDANMEILSSKDARKELFDKSRPIYTKTRDDMPTKYGLKCSVKNSIVADGCEIDGTVENCILFRGVKIKKGASLSNCIIMQDSVIGEGTLLSNVTTDKNVTVSDYLTLNGAEGYPLFIRKGENV